MSAKLKKQRSIERHALRVIKGGYTPADASTAVRLRGKGHRVGDLVFATFKRPRNPKFNRLVHQFGKLLAQNLDEFAGKDAHDVLKRLQIEGDIGCDHVGLNFPGVGPVVYRVPQSLAFESMDEDAFHEIYRRFTQHVSTNYWKNLSPEAIEQMAGMMPEDI